MTGLDRRAVFFAIAAVVCVVLVPATTALYRLAPPSFLAGYTFHFKVKQSSTRPGSRAS